MGVRIKDLRDTFASQLLTAYVQPGYVSQQLGHAGVAIAARHYAHWAGGDAYRAPIVLEPGEVPADLLARLAAGWSQGGHTLPRPAADLVDETLQFDGLKVDPLGLEPRTVGLKARCSTG